MKSTVDVFPGINRERDMARALTLISGQAPAMVWHADTVLPAGTDLVVIPGGFSYGDYLRCGAIAARAPVMDAVRAHAKRGGLVLGVCNGFQILCESGLLPGLLMRNAALRFVCREVCLRVEGEGRVLFRYTAPDGSLDPQWNLNGATNAIAGILDGAGNVLGMMPHPENHVEASMGSTDGRGLFAGLVQHLASAA